MPEEARGKGEESGVGRGGGGREGDEDLSASVASARIRGRRNTVERAREKRGKLTSTREAGRRGERETGKLVGARNRDLRPLEFRNIEKYITLLNLGNRDVRCATR